LLPLVYDELRKLAAAKLAHENPGQTLQATALVHEAYLRLVGPANADGFENCGHFFAAAAEAMRRILVERARKRASAKGGGHAEREPLGEIAADQAESDRQLLAIDAALARLQTADPQAAEVVKRRYFAGLTMEQTAASLGISTRTAYYAWQYARSWLRRELRQEEALEDQSRLRGA
jgi:RNA polymerase sigma factor (TIGR02999 family)